MKVKKKVVVKSVQGSKNDMIVLRRKIMMGQ